MKGWRFDVDALARAEADPNHDPYRAAGSLLRGYLGDGDILAEIRERARRDPKLRAMFADAVELLRAPAGIDARKDRD